MTSVRSRRSAYAAPTCYHYRQALFSLFRTLDGRDAPNPVRDIKPFTSPAPEARGLSYDVVQRSLAAMSDQGSARVTGKPRAAASATKIRCRVLAFTGLRPSELMRYLPEHWNRTAQTLVVYTGKGGRTRTIPLSAPAAAALADLEAVGAIGPFSTSTVRRAFIRAAARIGIHGVRPCDLCHIYGTARYRVAGDTLVNDLLGHSDSRMTERYTLGHVPEEMRAATAVFEKQLADRDMASSGPDTPWPVADREVGSADAQPEQRPDPICRPRARADDRRRA